MMEDGSDQPLLPEFDAPRRREGRKPGVRTYAGPATTCHVCIMKLVAGEPLNFPRSPATWSFLLESGRDWLVCAGHKALIDSGQMRLEDG